MSNALNSLYGDGHVNATRTRECVAMPGVRNQVVLTPQPVVDGLVAFWGQVEYDPCHAPGSLINARRTTRTRGLIDHFIHKTFCNPPYGKSLFDPENELETWEREEAIRAQILAEAKAESKRRGRKVSPKYPPRTVEPMGLGDWLERQMLDAEGESIMLVPHRTNRKWYRRWLSQLDACIELDPLAFHGAKSAAPFPLALGFSAGPASQDAPGSHHVLERINAFKDAFAHLGDPR